MRRTGLISLLAVTAAALGWAAPASAHPVSADGLATEWGTRLPASPNLGIVARDAAGTGEHEWLDVGA